MHIYLQTVPKKNTGTCEDLSFLIKEFKMGETFEMFDIELSTVFGDPVL
jgi:hypothetical protein